MTYHQIFVLIVGLGFIYGSITFFSKSKKISLIALLIGAFILVDVFNGHLSKSKEKQNEVINLKVEEINSLIIKQCRTFTSLSFDSLIIEDSQIIDEIKISLVNSKEALNPSGNRSDWCCVLKFTRNDKEPVTFRLLKKKDNSIIEIYSDGEYGTNYGSLINENLGNLVEELIINK